LVKMISARRPASVMVLFGNEPGERIASSL
jgi:hypothetical protein